jgi:outer membrane protein insertion porin family
MKSLQSRLLTVISLAIIGWTLLATPALAQSLITKPALITQIVVTGNQRIEHATIKNQINLSLGTVISPDTLNRAFKRLFDTGYFNDIVFSLQDSILTIKVRENPHINYVVIEGNRRIKDDPLLASLSSKPRGTYTVRNVQQDVKRILQLYSASGRFATRVTPKVIPLEHNRVNLVFEINEGPLASIQRIVFIGNKHINDSTLLDAISSQEDFWYRFVGSRTTFDQGRVAVDRDLLARYYKNHGFPHAKIHEPQVELSPSGTDFYISFTIEEGPLYRFGDTSIISDIQDISPSSLKPFVAYSKGQVYNNSKIQDSLTRIQEYLGTHAYAFAQATPSLSFNEENATVDVTITTQSGGTAFIEKINIQGNSRTWDNVIRREMRLQEGDIFDSSRIRRSVSRIQNLGYLKDVNVSTVPGSFPDSVILNTSVKEQPSNKVSFAVGYSTTEQIIAKGSLSEQNILGTGNSVGIEGQISSQRLSGTIFYHEPYFLDSHVSSTFRLFSSDNRSSKYRTYDFYRYGGSVSFGYELGEFLRQSWTYTIDKRTVSNISDASSIYVKSQEGETLVTSLKQNISYDRRDKNINPSSGYRISFSSEYAMTPGDARYIEIQGSTQAYYPLTPSTILGARINAGHISGLEGQNVRLVDRFYKGGFTLRGFDFAGVGPRDSSTKDNLGGQNFAILSLSVRFDLGFPKEYNIQGIVYSDIGTVTGIEDKNQNVVDTGSIRMGYGFGFEWVTPIGPLVMLFSSTAIKEDLDEERGFLFTIGHIN